MSDVSRHELVEALAAHAPWRVRSRPADHGGFRKALNEKDLFLPNEPKLVAPRKLPYDFQQKGLPLSACGVSFLTINAIVT